MNTNTSLLSDLKAQVIPALVTSLNIGVGEAEKITAEILPDLAQAILGGDSKLTAELEAQIKAAALLAHRKIQPGILSAITSIINIGLAFVTFKLGALAQVAQGLLPVVPGATG